MPSSFFFSLNYKSMTLHSASFALGTVSFAMPNVPPLASHRCGRSGAVVGLCCGSQRNMPKRQRHSTPSTGLGAAAERWLDDYDAVSKWMSQYNLPRLLKRAGGLVRIPNFFPPHIAAAIHSMLEALPEEQWVITKASEDYARNNISHSFWSTKRGQGLEAVTRALTLLQPGRFHTFSAARYCNSHHIAPHDDRAYSQVLMDDGQLVTCSRDIAVIYYLTKDWREEYGGNLIDHEGGATLVPLFNSIVAFTVPRYHEVTAMTVDRPRYSIFGWFLEPGIKYELFTGEEKREAEAKLQLKGTKGTAHAKEEVDEEGQQGLGGVGDRQGQGQGQEREGKRREGEHQGEQGQQGGQQQQQQLRRQHGESEAGLLHGAEHVSMQGAGVKSEKGLGPLRPRSGKGRQGRKRALLMAGQAACVVGHLGQPGLAARRQQHRERAPR